MSFTQMHNDYLDPDRAGLNDEHLDNQYFKEAFADFDSPADLYRALYKYTACGPYLSVRINYWKTIEPDGFDEYPSDQEASEWVHCGELHKLGTWDQMDDRGQLITAMMVGSIVEGVDQTTDDHEIEAQQLDEEPDAFRDRLFKAVDKVNAEARSIWNDTHGCETCAAHWRSKGLEVNDVGEVMEGCDGVTPVWEECPDCEGAGAII